MELRAAEHLVGASFELLEHKRGRFVALVVASSWDSPESARKYFELYQRVMRGKWNTKSSRAKRRIKCKGAATRDISECGWTA